MAVEKTITQSAEIVALPVGMPRVEIPGNVVAEKYGGISFAINTAAESVRVKSWATRYWDCRGTVAALVAAGLLRPEWCPGIPGNGKSRQAVLFDSTGPRLLIGGHKGRPLKQAHITVCRYSARTFSVEIPITPEQCERIEAFHEQCRARAKIKREKGERDESKRFWDGHDQQVKEARFKQSPEKLRENGMHAVDTFELIWGMWTDGEGVHYADDVMAEISKHLSAISEAILTGRILSAASQYQREGNVVYFPGSTDVEKQECGGLI